MKLNIVAEDAKYYVNEEKRIVVCVIEDTERLFIDFANSNFKLPSDCDSRRPFITSPLYNKLYMPNRFTGIARCMEGDTWNEDIGRAIAYSRAKANLLKSFYKRASTYVNYVDNCMNEAVDIINSLGQKVNENQQKRTEYIERLLEANGNAADN